MAHRHLRHIQCLGDIPLIPAQIFQSRRLKSPQLPPILRQAILGVHDLSYATQKFKLLYAAVSKVDHPFATKRFKTDGRSIFADLRKTHGERPLIDLADNQLTFRKVIEPHLKDIDFDSKNQATRWWPLGSKHRVLLDPQRSFGQPIVREGVPTSVLARAAKREQSVEAVAKWFEVDVAAVRDAIQFERNIAA